MKGVARAASHKIQNVLQHLRRDDGSWVGFKVQDAMVQWRRCVSEETKIHGEIRTEMLTKHLLLTARSLAPHRQWRSLREAGEILAGPHRFARVVGTDQSAKLEFNSKIEQLFPEATKEAIVEDWTNSRARAQPRPLGVNPCGAKGWLPPGFAVASWNSRGLVAHLTATRSMKKITCLQKLLMFNDIVLLQETPAAGDEVLRNLRSSARSTFTDVGSGEVGQVGGVARIIKNSILEGTVLEHNIMVNSRIHEVRISLPLGELRIVNFHNYAIPPVSLRAVLRRLSPSAEWAKSGEGQRLSIVMGECNIAPAAQGTRQVARSAADRRLLHSFRQYD